MKRLFLILIPLTLGLIISQTQAANKTSLSTEQDKLSYSLGFDIGGKVAQGFKSQSIQVEPTVFAKGVSDAMAGNKPIMSSKDMQKTVMTFQQKMVQKAQKEAQSAINANRQSIFHNNKNPVMGDPNGPVTLVEFFDYQCVHCRAFAPTLNSLIKQDPKLRVVLKEFPIFGANSEFAAKAALAAQQQGKYMQFHNALMDSDKPLTNDEVLKLAKQAGLDVKQLQKDMQASAISKQIKANQKLAEKLGINGTPTLIISTTNANNNAGNKEITAIMIPGAPPMKYLEKVIAQMQNQGNGNFKFKDSKPPKRDKSVWQGI